MSPLAFIAQEVSAGDIGMLLPGSGELPSTPAASAPLDGDGRGDGAALPGCSTPTTTVAVASLVEAVEHLALETSAAASPGGG